MTKESSEVPVLAAFPLALVEGPRTLSYPRHSIYHHIYQVFLVLIVHRTCPGLHFAENSIRIAVAAILYCFEIRKTKGEDSMEIEPVVDFDDSIRSVQKTPPAPYRLTAIITRGLPKPFKCVTKPRSEVVKGFLYETSVHDE